MPKTLISPRQFYFFTNRFAVIQWIFIFLFIILFVQIFNLQIINGKKYKELALNNREQYIPIQTYRGEIFDRNFNPGKDDNIPLVTNEETMGVYILPLHLKLGEAKNILLKLSYILNYDYNDVINSFTNRRNYYEPFLIKDDVSIKDIAKIAETIHDLPGIYWKPV